MKQFARTELLLGRQKLDRLRGKRVAIFGVGGVGGYVAEALARSGVGEFTLIDADTVSETNINRQIIALHSTIGRNKVDVMKERILDINPEAQVEARICFYLPENADTFDFTQYDYVVDAVDTVTAKIDIIARAKETGVPVISSMGAGNKLDPGAFKISYIEKTSVCPLAKVMRYELKKRGISGVKCVYSTEPPIKEQQGVSEEVKTGLEQELLQGKRSIPGSIAYVPSVAGLMIASEIIKDL